MNPKVVCHISYHHPLDDRIYWKELLCLKEAGFTAVHICLSDKNEEYITAEGIHIIEIKRRKLHSHIWLNRIANLFFKKNGIQNILLQKAASLKADVYHYHDLQVNVIAKKLKNLPHHPIVIYDVHEVYWMVVKEQRKKGIVYYLRSRLISFMYKRWEAKQAAPCDYIIATDDFTLQYFARKLPGVPKSIIYNYSYFLPPPLSSATKKIYHFIYTGLLSESRGILDAVKAVELLVQEFKDIQLLLIGTFETAAFEEKIKTFITRHRLQQNIHIHAQVPFQQIKSFYEASQIGLGLFHPTPKYTTFIPIKLFEYMAFGLPVIFTNQGPSGTIIKEEKCGILIPPKDINAIVAAMKILLSDTALYATYSSHAREAVKAKYNWEKEKQKLLSIYNHLLPQ